MHIKRIFTVLAFLPALFGLTACDIAGAAVGLPGQETGIVASGTIDTDSVRVAPELSGKIKKVSVQKGSLVKAGDVLFELDDVLLQAKYDQAKAQVQFASAALDTAKQGLTSAKMQYQLALDASRSGSEQVEARRWKENTLDSINLPNWYFQKSESILAIQSEVEAAAAALDEEEKALQKTLQNSSNKDFVAAEERVNRAQAAFEIADQTLTQANDSVGNDKTTLTDAAQKLYDQAQTELDAAQKSYNAIQTGNSATDVKEARARVATARARLENAQDALNALLTRDDARQIENVQIGVDSAQKAIAQAEANLVSAQAVQHEVEVQLAKLSVSSPVSGVVLSNPVKAGEVAAAGATVYEIGVLDEVKLTVYVTEDQFGRLKLGDSATVKVDSYPNESFAGKVVYISDEAEFTPRNVQTVESRSTTVYAVEIRLANPDYKLKPGMPADANIQ